MSTTTPLLEVRGIAKQYPGVRALKGVDFDVHAGEVHCLLGPNGAGKSTLIKCVSGVVAPTEGEILVDGDPLPTGEPSESLARGVATIYQELDLVEDLTVAESVFLGHEPRRPGCSTGARMRREATALLDAPGPRRHPAGRARADAAPRRAAGGLDRPRAVAPGPAADHGRAVGDPRRPGGRGALRRGPAPGRRRRRRDLHLPPARRDPPDRRPRDGARRRRTVATGLPADTPPASWSRRWSAAGSSSCSPSGPPPSRTSCSTSAASPAARREATQLPGPRGRGARHRRARRRRAHRAAAADLRPRGPATGEVSSTASACRPGRTSRHRARDGARAGGPQVPGAAARLEPGARTSASPTSAGSCAAR